MKLTILGTGNAMVTKCYNTCFAIENNNDCMLVDAGGGNTILGQLEKAGIRINSISSMFVTHKHIDHLLGAVWIIRAAAQEMLKGKMDGELIIYSHDEVIELLKDISGKLLQSKQAALIGNRIHLKEVADGESFKAIGLGFTAFDIQSSKAKQFGFTMYYGEKKLTCCGDEPFSECERKYAENSDWLMHEAFCLFGEADKFKPYEKHHSTAKDAAELAEGLGVKNLILYHTEDKNLAKRKELYSAEGRKYYSGNLYVPDDLEVIEI